MHSMDCDKGPQWSARRLIQAILHTIGLIFVVGGYDDVLLG